MNKKTFANLLPRSWVRWIRYRRTDVFLISYPKSGRTWLRFMLGHAITSHFNLQVDNLLGLSQLARMNPAIPRILVNHDDNPHLKKTAALETDKRPYRHAKLILLCRDPRDVLVSLYFHKSRRDRQFTGTLSEFIDAPAGGFNNILRFYEIWAENRDVPQSFHLVRYEDLHQNPLQALRNLFNFMGLMQINDTTLSEAIAFAGFDKMRQMEKQGQVQTTNRLQPGNVIDVGSYKTRRGKVGGYVDYLSEAEISDLNERMRQRLPCLYSYSPCRSN